jgi:hypothetical protein
MALSLTHQNNLFMNFNSEYLFIYETRENIIECDIDIFYFDIIGSM